MNPDHQPSAAARPHVLSGTSIKSVLHKAFDVVACLRNSFIHGKREAGPSFAHPEIFAAIDYGLALEANWRKEGHGVRDNHYSPEFRKYIQNIKEKFPRLTEILREAGDREENPVNRLFSAALRYYQGLSITGPEALVVLNYDNHKRAEAIKGFYPGKTIEPEVAPFVLVRACAAVC